MTSDLLFALLSLLVTLSVCAAALLQRLIHHVERLEREVLKKLERLAP